MSTDARNVSHLQRHNEHVMDKIQRSGNSIAAAVAAGGTRSAKAAQSIAAATGLPGLEHATYTPRSIQEEEQQLSFEERQQARAVRAELAADAAKERHDEVEMTMLKTGGCAIFMCWGGYALITYLNTGAPPFESAGWGPGRSILICLAVMFAILCWVTSRKKSEIVEKEKLKDEWSKLQQRRG